MRGPCPFLYRLDGEGPSAVACNRVKQEREKEERIYAAIDLKSFYASVECVERGLDPMCTNLVVADAGRTEKTICLAVTPALKAYGISGRPRLFEVIRAVENINRERSRKIHGKFRNSSIDARELELHPEYALEFITAPPRMALYIDYSARIQGVYLRYIAPKDIYVYSVDEVFIDLTSYLSLYGMSAGALVKQLIREILETTGITATAGMGTNLYLAKVAMDIGAKHIEPDAEGMRIAELDEMSYRKQLWCHTPLTDFWRVGRGTASRLENHGMRTMGDVARRSITHEETLYQLFGVNAELLIDHAWGKEPCTIVDIKAYQPRHHCLSSGQVLPVPYSAEKGRLIAREMADALALELTEKRLVAESVSLTVNYEAYRKDELERNGPEDLHRDRYGRTAPKPAHGSRSLHTYTASSQSIIEGVDSIYTTEVDPRFKVRRLTVSVNNVLPEHEAPARLVQGELFTDAGKSIFPNEKELARERRIQQTVLGIKKRFGKNAILKGMNLKEGSTARQRHTQIGGHQA